jgi:hypothetical protein
MKSTEYGEFCRLFFENLKFGQILSRNSNFERPKSTEIPKFRPFHSGPVKNQNQNPNPLSKLSYFAHCRRVDVREAASGTLLVGCLSGHSGVVFRHVPTLQENFHLSLYGFLVEEYFSTLMRL